MDGDRPVGRGLWKDRPLRVRLTVGVSQTMSNESTSSAQRMQPTCLATVPPERNRAVDASAWVLVRGVKVESNGYNWTVNAKRCPALRAARTHAACLLVSPMES